MDSHHHVERVLIVATCLAQTGHGGAAAQMGLLCREFRADRGLWDALAQRRGPKGRTNLLHAALKGDAARVGFLIDRGAAVDWVSKEGSPLTLACQGSSDAIALLMVRQLVTSKPELVRDVTPLPWACSKGHLDTVRYLVEKGAEVNGARVGALTPLHAAASYGHLAVVRFLVSCSGINVNASFSDGTTALMYACNYGFTAMARHLAEARGIAVGAARASDGKTALMMAIDKSPESLETAAFLLRHGAAASVNAVSPAGGSALSRACSAGNLPLLHMLISHGATVNLPAPATPPLLLALDGGHEKVVSALLLLGANARAVDAAGRQALLVAVRGGHGKAARALLESGADARASDGAGSALAAAARKGCAEAVRVLLQHGADGLEVSTGDGTPLLVAAREGHLEAVRALLEGGADCAAVGAAGCTPLLAAVRGAHFEVVEELVSKRKASAKDVDAAGCSVLLLACVHGGKAPLIDLLCASGANANAAATGAVAGTCIIAGTTPLMAAAASVGSLDALKALQQHGATLRAKDSAGREARDYAFTKAAQAHLKGLP